VIPISPKLILLPYGDGIPVSTQTSSAVGSSPGGKRPLKIPIQPTLGNEKDIGKCKGGSIAGSGTVQSGEKRNPEYVRTR